MCIFNHFGSRQVKGAWWLALQSVAKACKKLTTCLPGSSTASIDTLALEVTEADTTEQAHSGKQPFVVVHSCCSLFKSFVQTRRWFFRVVSGREKGKESLRSSRSHMMLLIANKVPLKRKQGLATLVLKLPKVSILLKVTRSVRAIAVQT